MPESSSNSFGSPLPVFRVKNVEASIAYYLDALGFELRWRAPVREKSIAPTGSPAANRLRSPTRRAITAATSSVSAASKP